MTGNSRYWDHDRCAWIAYEPTTLASPEALGEALPEQRADEETTPVAEAAPVTTS
jgi:hypothetical protein